jgi:hypothetical protein
MKKLIAALAVVALHRSGHDRRRRHPGAAIMRVARIILDAAAPLRSVRSGHLPAGVRRSEVSLWLSREGCVKDRSRRLAIATLAWVLLLPGVAVAWHDGRSHDRGVHPPTLAHPSSGAHPQTPQGPVRFKFLRFGPSVVQTPPPVVYVQSPPVVYVQSPPVVYVVPPVGYSPEPNPSYDVPTPRVEPAPEIVLPTGRWELHGDGVTWPHVWVWVPSYQPLQATPRVEPPAPPLPRSS